MTTQNPEAIKVNIDVWQYENTQLDSSRKVKAKTNWEKTCHDLYHRQRANLPHVYRAPTNQ